MSRPKKIKVKCDIDTHLRLSLSDYDFLSNYSVLNGYNSVSYLIRSILKSWIISKKGELSDADFQTYLNN